MAPGAAVVVVTSVARAGGWYGVADFDQGHNFEACLIIRLRICPAGTVYWSGCVPFDGYIAAWKGYCAFAIFESRNETR